MQHAATEPTRRKRQGKIDKDKRTQNGNKVIAAKISKRIHFENLIEEEPEITIESLLTANNLDPENSFVYPQIIACFNKLDDQKNADKWTCKFFENSPNVFSYGMMIDFYIKKNDVEGALITASEAILKFNNYLHCKKYIKAIKKFHPKMYHLYLEIIDNSKHKDEVIKAFCLMSLGEPDEALKKFEEANIKNFFLKSYLFMLYMQKFYKKYKTIPQIYLDFFDKISKKFLKYDWKMSKFTNEELEAYFKIRKLIKNIQKSI